MRGFQLLATSTLGFASLIYMPLGEFTAIIMLTPLMVTLLAAAFLRERVNLLRWLLVLGGFSGALPVVQPAGSAIGWANVLPLSLVVVYALFQILTSRMARTEDAMTMHFDHVPGPLELWGIALIVVCGASTAWLAARGPRTEASGR